MSLQKKSEISAFRTSTRVRFHFLSRLLTSFITGWKHLIVSIRESPLALSALQTSKGRWHDLISSVLRNHLTLSARHTKERSSSYINYSLSYIISGVVYIYKTTLFISLVPSPIWKVNKCLFIDWCNRRYQVRCLAWQSLIFFSSQRGRSLTIKLKGMELRYWENIFILSLNSVYVVDFNLKVKNIKNYLML